VETSIEAKDERYETVSRLSKDDFRTSHGVSPLRGAIPARERWDGWGFEYKSKVTLWGMPLVHISFKYRPNRMPVPAKGIIAIGQFACGVMTISQFGVGLVSVSQFTVAGFALTQFAVAYSMIAQSGLYLHEGHGQFVKNVMELFG
jgi:hypothetical protein